ncbi:hypothetical protein NicSoilC12_06500 [Arthrobacter sp. NicSoilC12]|nr:hypothetical protein NicSoilC12_06500 [Arthrobacter sp. NicSoilC12]
MTNQQQDRDPWEEFDRLQPAGPDRVAGYPVANPRASASARASAAPGWPSDLPSTPWRWGAFW